MQIRPQMPHRRSSSSNSPPPPQQQQQKQRQQSQDNGVLVLAQLDQLASASAPSADKTVTTVPTQRRLTRQIVQNHAPFVALRQANQQTRFGEQRLLQSSQKYPAVADTSVLRGEMQLLEPEGEDAEPRKLYYAPLTFLSHVGSHSIEWPLDLWQTFVSSSLGASIPILVHHPRMPRYSRLALSCRPLPSLLVPYLFYLYSYLLGFRHLG